MTREQQAAALAEGLFASSVATSAPLDVRTARQTALATLQAEGGARTCAAAMAAAFGEYPDTAVARMRWARAALGLAA